MIFGLSFLHVKYLKTGMTLYILCFLTILLRDLFLHVYSFLFFVLLGDLPISLSTSESTHLNCHLLVWIPICEPKTFIQFLPSTIYRPRLSTKSPSFLSPTGCLLIFSLSGAIVDVIKRLSVLESSGQSRNRVGNLFILK